jgi:uncharacterized 2Fe-2S/4Fe-4S cluster protein (DUF4445 family)
MIMEIRILNGKTITATPDENIYQALRNSGVYLVASCGGKGVCGKCRVKVHEGKYRTESATKLKKKDIGENIVLACTTFPEEDILIEIPEESKLVIGDKIAVSKSKVFLDFLRAEEPVLTPPVRKILLTLMPPTIEDNISDVERLKRALSEHAIHDMRFSHGFIQSMAKSLRQHAWSANLTYTENFEAISIVSPERMKHYGLAIDIGTTTVVVYLVDCTDGTLLDVGVTFNSQMRFGDDVITRIVHATEGGAIHELRNAVINDINGLLGPMVQRNHINRDDIDCVVLSGNTTMAQLFWGIDPSSIREEPYIPTVNAYPVWKASVAKIMINHQAPIYTMPCVGSYVGGDITAGVLASKMHRNPEVALFMDIGTNGEIVVGNNEWLITAATSAGPCFEGSGIRHGMRATEGAIESIKIDSSTFEVQLGIIGDAQPTGICGSGMIDAISELFFTGIIDQKGKFMRDLNTDRIRIDEEGPEFILHRGEVKDIVLTEADIENILRAKAAIYAGMSVLLKEVGLSLDIVERIYIAGGFGNYLNVEKAIMIGMLPDMPQEKFSFIGNTSIAGAYLCLLSDKMRREAEEIAKTMTYVELSVSRGFMDEYMSALFLPHTNIDLFPSIKEMYNRRA